MGLFRFATAFFQAASAQRNGRRATKTYRRGRRVLFEALEPRILLNGSISPVSGIVQDFAPLRSGVITASVLTNAQPSQASASSASTTSGVSNASAAPAITGVTFSGSGQGTTMVISGSGFGNGPFSSAFTGDLNDFSFSDLGQQPGNTTPIFTAGNAGFASGQADSVTLDYESWSNNQIIVSGFGGTYGQNGATLAPGDSVSITVWNSADTGAGGTNAGWSGTVAPVTAPNISSVQFASTGSGGYKVTVNGSGFGSPATSAGYVGDSPYFRIADAAQLGFGEWGYSGDANVLTYQSWTDNQIVVTGFGGSAGDAITLALWNKDTGLGAAWGGNVTPVSAATPQITGVVFSGYGQGTTITVTGTGFGNSPFSSPFTGDVNNFDFTDFRSHSTHGSSLFEAGGSLWGIRPADTVTLDYQSWSNEKIVISGFGGTYGQGTATLQPGDPVVISLWNSTDTSVTGPQTAWAGTATVAAAPSISSVEIAPAGSGTYSITINGTGFGNSPVPAGYYGDTPYFRIADAAQLGFGEWGYSGDAKQLTYQSWTDSQIVVSGLQGSPGDALTLAVWNPVSGVGATWGGNLLAASATAPQITGVTFSGSGQDTAITITGTDFGNSPFSSPLMGDLNNLAFNDFRTHSGSGSSLFEAGGDEWGVGSPDGVTLDYQSWSNNQIVVSGFGGTYGQNGATLAPGDPVTIVLWNSADSNDTGPQTAWAGTIVPQPQISSVQIMPTGSGGYSITVNGSGFGGAPVPAGYTGDTPYFRIADAAQLGFGEWGYTGDGNQLTYQSWTDNQIVVTGFRGSADDALTMAVWNPSSGLGATWGGNVPPVSSTTPQITGVTFAGSGQNTTITITGTGFGSAPSGIPFTGDINNLVLTDFRAHSASGSSLFEAGGNLWGVRSPDSVTLDYRSWSSTQIVISGFAGTYGQNGATFEPGDPITITLWNSADTADTGPQTTWAGNVAAGTIVNHLVFETEPTSVTAGTPTSTAVTVEIEDANGNVVTGDNSYVTLSIYSGPTGGVLAGEATAQAQNGVAVFSNLVLDTAGSYVLAVADTTDNLDAVSSTAITVAPAAPVQLVFTTQPTGTAPNSRLAPVVVAIEDQFGNVEALDNTSVSLTATGPGGFAAGSTTSVTAVSGVATFNNLALTNPGTYTLEASDPADNTPGASSSAFTISAGASAATQLVFLSLPLNATAGSALAQFTVNLEDANGHIVTSDNPTISLEIDQGPTGAQLGGTDQVAAVNGIATFGNLMLDTAGNYTLKAVDAASNLAAVATVAVVVTPAVAADLLFTTQPTNGMPNSPLAPVVVTIRDKYGNVETSDDSSVGLTVSNPGVFASGSTTTVDAVSGVATFSNLELTTAGTFTLTAADTTDSLTSNPSGNFTTTSGPTAAKLVFVSLPNTATAGSALSQFAVEIEDANGQVLTGDNTTITLSSVNAPPGAGVGGEKQIEAENGIATFSNVLLDTAGTYTLQASDAQDNLAITASGPINVAPATAERLAFTTQPGNTAVNATISPAVVVKIEDQFGNTVTSDGSTVSLTLSGTTGGAFTSGSTTTINAQNGAATFNNLAIDAGGNYTFVAHDSADNLPTVDSSSFQVTTATAASLGFTSVPNSAVAGQPFSISVEILDANGQAIQGDNSDVTLNIESGPITETISTVEAQNGIANFSGVNLTEAGPYTFRASDSTDNLTSSPSNTLTLRPAAPHQLDFYTPPVGTSAGNTMQPVVVVIQDQYGNIETGDNSSVSLSASGPGSFVGSNSVTVSTKNGEADFDYDLALDTAGTYEIIATDSSDGLGATSTNTFTITAASPAKLKFDQGPTNSKQGVAISPALTVEVDDAFGNRCSNDSSAVTISGPSGVTLGGQLTAYAQNGLATFSDVIVQTAGDGLTLRADDGNLAGASSSSFNVQSTGPQWVQWGELDLFGAFQSNGGNQVATGTVEIALYPTGSESPNPLITITGSGDQVSYNSSTFTASGTVNALLDNVGPLFAGSFTIANGQTSTSGLTQTNTPFQFVGLAAHFNSLSLVNPGGGSTANAEIEANVSVTLPAPLNSISLTSINVLVTHDGVSPASTTIPFPDVAFVLYGFEFDATSMSITFNSAQKELVVQGDFGIKGLFGGSIAEADFSGGSSGIFIQGSSVNLDGEISLNQSLNIGGGYGVNSASLNVDSLTNTYSGEAEIQIPGLPAVAASLGLVDGKVNSFSLQVGSFADPIDGVGLPVLSTGIFLDGVQGGVSGVATGVLVFSGTLYLTYGPDAPIALPSWLDGGGSGNVDFADLTVSATVSSSDITGSVQANFIDIDGSSLISANGNLDLNFASSTLTAQVNFSMVDGIITANAGFEITPSEFSLYATGSINVPDGIPVIGGQNVAGGGIELVYAYNNPTDQYFDIWGTINYWLGTATGGAHIDLNPAATGTWGYWIFSAPPNPSGAPATLTTLSASASELQDTFTVGSGTPYVLLTASWANAAVNVPVQITAPDGTTYSEADFPNTVAFVGQLGSPTSETVAISNPAAGNWTITLPDTTNLGTVSFSALAGEPLLNPTLAFLQTPAGATTGAALAPLVVDVINGNGQLAINDSSQITLSVASGPGQPTGTVTATAVDGVAQFNNVFLNTAGAYTLLASDPIDGISGVKSTGFAVLPATPANLRMSAQDGEDALAWTASAAAGPLTYNLYRSTPSDVGDWVPIATGLTSTAFTDASAGQYLYQVVADQNGQISAPSNIAGVSTPSLVSAESVKTQGVAGTFGINLPLTGTPAVEDRIDGPTQLVLTFQNPIKEGSSFAVNLSSGTLGTTSVSGNTLTIDLSGAAQGQTLTVGVNDVEDASTGASGNYSLQVGVLYGDVNGNGLVNVADINMVRQASGEAVNATDFRDDLNCNGLINVADINIVRQLSGGSLSSASVGAVQASTAEAVPMPTLSANSEAPVGMTNNAGGTPAPQGTATTTAVPQTSAASGAPLALAAKPVITSVALSPLAQASDNWQMTISGTGFGTQSPYTGDSGDLAITVGAGFNAGYTGDAVTAHVSEWTSDEIVINGLAGGYGLNGWIISPGNSLLFAITNPQDGLISNAFEVVA